MSSGSKSFSLDATDLKKIAKGALIAAAGGAVAYFASLIPGIDQSTALGGLFATAGSVAIQFARKWLADNS